MKKFIAGLGLLASTTAFAGLDETERKEWLMCSKMHDFVVTYDSQHLFDVSGYAEMHESYLASASSVQIRRFEKERATHQRKLNAQHAGMDDVLETKGFTDEQGKILAMGFYFFDGKGTPVHQANECF